MSSVSIVNNTSTSDNEVSWKDGDIYPKAEEIALALQDPGKAKVVKKKGSELSQFKFPLIEKLCNKIYNNIMKEFEQPRWFDKEHQSR